MRLPASQLAVVKDFLATYQRKKLATDLSVNLDAVGDLSLAMLDSKPIKLLLFTSKVPAGFPSPAEEHVEKRLDPSEFLIDQIEAAFFVNIQGYLMIDVSLMPRDIAVIDRSELAFIGGIALALVDGEYTIKVMSSKKNGTPR